MKALVTGATGFLGRHLCLELIKQGWSVVGMGRNINIGKWLENNQVIFLPIDLVRPDIIKFQPRAYDVVFHCAALSSVWGEYDQFYKINVEGTKRLAKACIEASIRRFIHVSTPSIYFNFNNHVNIKENTELPGRFVNHYADTKHQAERLLLEQYCGELNVSIIRPRGIFGEYDTAIMPRLLTLAQRGTIPLPKGGRATIDVTYVKNVTDAMIALIDAGRHTFSEVYNISNQQPVTVKSLLTQVCQAINLPVKFRNIPY